MGLKKPQRKKNNNPFTIAASSSYIESVEVEKTNSTEKHSIIIEDTIEDKSSGLDEKAIAHESLQKRSPSTVGMDELKTPEIPKKKGGHLRTQSA